MRLRISHACQSLDKVNLTFIELKNKLKKERIRFAQILRRIITLRNEHARSFKTGAVFFIHNKNSSQMDASVYKSLSSFNSFSGALNCKQVVGKHQHSYLMSAIHVNISILN